MKKHDFLLFENYHIATHHKIDLLLIAKLLQSKGKGVAILDIYGEEENNELEGIPIVKLPFPSFIPNDRWKLSPRNKIHSMFALLRFLWQQHWYMKKVVKAIEPMSDYFYCGSYHTGMSSQLCLMRKPCYYWGLRTERLRDIRKHLLKNFIDGLHMWWLKRRFMKNPYQRLFVSNMIIMSELEKIGLNRGRMTIREERVVDEIGDAYLPQLPEKLTFLVIGQLRKQKNVPFTIAAFKKADISESQLKLVGSSNEKYEKEILQAIENDYHVKRVNKFLSYEDFNKNILSSHFVLFADEQGSSCITNGTMMEALINHRPIICPDYNPYKYYVGKYHVGLLYKSGDMESYVNTIKKAVELGVNSFIPSINLFLQNITFEKVAADLLSGIEENDKIIAYNQKN